MSGPAPTASPKDRLLQSLRAIIREEFPRLTFFGLYEFIVQASAAGDQASLVPSDATIGLPGLVQVPQRLPGTSATLTPGSMCLLQFVNGDPARPVVVNHATTPLTVDLDASLSMRIGKSSPSVALGAAPLPLATSAGTLTTIGLLTTFVASVTSAAQTCVSAGNTLPAIGVFVTAVNTAGGVVASGLAAAIALIPTTTIKAGP